MTPYSQGNQRQQTSGEEGLVLIFRGTMQQLREGPQTGRRPWLDIQSPVAANLLRKPVVIQGLLRPFQETIQNWSEQHHLYFTSLLVHVPT